MSEPIDICPGCDEDMPVPGDGAVMVVNETNKKIAMCKVCPKCSDLLDYPESEAAKQMRRNVVESVTDPETPWIDGREKGGTS